MTAAQHPTSPHHTYSVTPRVLIFPQYEDQILLLKGAPTKPLWPNMYNGVGGHVEPGETVRHAALRELDEETGICATDLCLCGMVSINLGDAGSDVMLFVFTCLVDSSITRPGPEGTLEWFPWDALPDKQLMPDLPILLPRVRFAAQTNSPFYALYTYDEAGSLQIAFED